MVFMPPLTGGPNVLTGGHAITPAHYQLLSDTLRTHGVDLTSTDVAVMEWIAGWEPETVRVICSWVMRATSCTA